MLRLERVRRALRRRVTDRYRDLPLLWKVLLPFTLLLLLVGVTGAFLVVRDLTSRAEREIDRDLLTRSVTARAVVLDNEFYLLESVRLATNLQGLGPAVDAGDRASVGDLISSVVAVKERLDLLVVTDAAGVGLVEVHSADGTKEVEDGNPWAEDPLVAKILDGGLRADENKEAGLMAARGQPFVAVGGPVRAGEGVVGSVIAGISAEVLVAEVSDRTSSDAALYGADGEALAMAAGFARAPMPSGDVNGPVRVSSGDEDGDRATLFAPFEVGSSEMATLALQVGTDQALAGARRAAWRLSMLLAVSMAFVVGLGLLLSRSIAGRIRPLIETNRALGRGDLSARVHLRGHDELGELAGGINQMAEQLQAGYGELETRVAERTEEVQRLYQDLLEASRARTELLTGITHDFRTPLFTIRGHATMMLDPEFRPDDPAWRAAFGETISGAADELMRMVDDLLDHAELESGDAGLKIRGLDLRRYLQELGSTIVPLARSAEVEATVEVQRDLPHVMADPDRLRQIVLNLVSNAIKYTPSGGRLRVRAAAKGRRRVEVTVTDTGVGIPTEAGDRVFEPFYRVPGTEPQKRQASSGLGLAITKRLVEAHGGAISYRSDEAGTTFTFTLRVARQRAPQVRKGKKRRERSGAGSRRAS